MISVDSIVAPHYVWLRQELIPPAVEFWSRLDVPAWELYRAAFQECTADVIQSSKSSGYFLYLTFRPLAILGWVVLQFFWGVGQVLFRLLLEKGWISLQKGFQQAKIASVWFYRFQCSLSRNEILGEIAVIFVCVGLYYLRKWLKRQTYWKRVVLWCRRKKDRLIKSYAKALHRVAKFSLILAMTLPHFVFFGAGISFKIIFPSVVKWLAYDTYTTALLSVWYPLICTLGWIHEQRHGEKDNQKEAPIDAPSTSSVKQVATTCKADKATPKSKQRQNRKQPAYMKPTSAQKAREGANNTKRGTKTGVFPKTTPTSPSSGGNSSTSNIQEKQPSTEAPTTYWLRYWGVYALVQAIGHLCSMVPVFGRFVARHPFFLSFAAELKLLFFVWIFFMETLLRSTTGDSLLAEALPLRLLHRHVMPLVREFEAVVSEAVPKEAWKNWVHSKVQRLLEVFVMVRFISESSKDWLLHILDESRTLLLPSLSLLMPGFVTQFGVSYVQFLVPSVKSSNAKGEAAELLYLQYWVLHCILSGLFSWFSSILWWIPFSTHLIFLTWCHLSFPQTIAEYYSVVEMDLVAFGLLRGDPVVAVHETRTVQLLASLSKRLPSAVGDDDDVYALKEAESNMTEASKKIDPSISVDSSNESNQIEVSLRKFDLRKSDKQKACDNDIMLEPWPTWEDKENSNDPSEKEKDDTHPDIPASKTSTTQEDDLSESSYDTATGADKNTLKTVRRSTRNSKKTHC